MRTSTTALRASISALLLLALGARLPANPLLPSDLEARRAELKQVSLEAQELQKPVGFLVNDAIKKVPAFVQDLTAVHQVPLSNEERKALLEGGHTALPAEKAAVFASAEPSFTEMKSALTAYFQAYDAYMDAEIRKRTFGAVLGALERRAALDEHLSEKQKAELDEGFARLEELEVTYRQHLTDPSAREYLRPRRAKHVFFAADGMDDELLALERKYGLEPKLPWGHRVGNFFRGLKRKARLLKINAASLPAAARLFTHVFLRPFWNKEHDPEKTSDLIRFYSKSYRWAAGMKLNVRGQEGIPSDAPVVFALSHRATIEDAMTMTAVIPGAYSFMWAADAMPKWLAKRLVADPTVIAVGGIKEDGTRVDAVEESLKALKSGQNLALFPEGNVPTPMKETRPLRSGLDIITRELSEKPIYIVPVTIDDTAAGWDAENPRRSQTEKMDVNVTVGKPLDPLRLRGVPGADRQFLLDVVRGIYHRNLYRPDVPLVPPACEEVCHEETLGVIPDARSESFEALHAR